MAPAPYTPREASRSEWLVRVRMVGALLRGPLGLVVGLVGIVGMLVLLSDDVLPQGEPTSRADVQPSAQSEGVASVWVASEPTGVPVTIGGDSVGVTPVWVQGIASGRIFIRVGGGVAASDTVVTLRPGDDLDVSFALDMTDTLGDQPEMAAQIVQREPAAPAPRAPAQPATAPAEPRAARVPAEPRAARASAEPRAARASAEPRAARAPAPVRPPTPEPAQPERPVPPRAAPSPPLAANEAPQPRMRPGTLEVQVPAGSSVLIEGRLAATDVASSFTTRLFPGTYTVQVIYPSSRNEETTVYVGGGAVRTVITFGPDPEG